MLNHEFYISPTGFLFFIEITKPEECELPYCDRKAHFQDGQTAPTYEGSPLMKYSSKANSEDLEKIASKNP